MDVVPPNTVCLLCFKEVLDSEDGLECNDPFKLWFHRDCTKTSKLKYTKISSNTNHKWYCNRFDCKTAVASPFDRLLETLANLSDQITNLSGKVDSLGILPAKVDNIQYDLNSLNEKITAHETRISKVEERVDIVEEEQSHCEQERYWWRQHNS